MIGIKMKNKQFQYELWQECNNKCKFCFLGTENRKTSDEVKIANIKDFMKQIRSEEFVNEEYNNISLIGGEFFQGQLNTPEIKELFMKAIYEIVLFLRSNKTYTSWIAATMTRADNSDLYSMLEFCKNHHLFEKERDYGVLWLCTSYDTIGRFHTEQNKLNWENHMKNISQQFPMLKKNTCMILTQDLMEKYINDEIDFKEFSEEFGTSIFLKQPDRGHFPNKQMMMEKVPGFFPKRETALEFLVKLLNEDSNLFDNLMNVNLRASTLVKNYNDGEQQDCIRHKDELNEYGVEATSLPCGHSDYYACYEDSDKCILCDIKLLNGD